MCLSSEWVYVLCSAECQKMVVNLLVTLLPCWYLSTRDFGNLDNSTYINFMALVQAMKLLAKSPKGFI